jgi:hypothetical protein
MEVTLRSARAVADAIFVIGFATISLKLQEIGVSAKRIGCELVYEM